ncbi:MAG: thioredoxin domain-containing protein [Patescibacteria group bacterium]
MSIFPNDSNESVAGLNGSPKTMFYLGLATGVGCMAILALAFTLYMFMHGAIPAAGAGSQVAAAANQPSAAAPTNPSAQQPSAAAPSAPPAAVSNTDHIRGNKDAKVTLIEYSDYECPYCQKHEVTIAQILKDYPNDVRLVYRYFPLSSIHPNAERAAVAAECAAKQNKFWEMHDKLFQLGEAQTLDAASIKQAAQGLGLNANDFNKCLDGNETINIVNAEYQEGTNAGVSGTPATFVNGTMVEGAQPYSVFKAAIDSILAKK